MLNKKVHYILFQASVSRPNIICTINEIENNKSSDVVLMIHTAGGKSIEVFHFFNYIKSRKINLTTYNLGFIGSAGVSLFLCGENRICSPFSSFMLHERSWRFNGSLTTKEMSEYILRGKVSDALEYDFFKERSGDLCAKRIMEWSKKDTEISPSEALCEGLCTDIGQISIADGMLLSRIQAVDFGEQPG